MNARIVGAILVALVIGLGAGYLFFGGRVSAQAQGASDLIVGQAYQVGDFRACEAPDGSRRTEWHFAGRHRSLRNQQTPALDGRGRKIFRVATGDPSLPAGHMRLRAVSESDPALEGHTYGNYAWSGVVVEYNGRVERQRSVGPCGPAR